MAVSPSGKAVQVECVVSPMFMENAFLIYIEGEVECIIVDPSFDTDSLLARIESAGLQPSTILNTHGHSDHIACKQLMKDKFPEVPLMIGENDDF